jgi:hypothetical protein
MKRRTVCVMGIGLALLVACGSSSGQAGFADPDEAGTGNGSNGGPGSPFLGTDPSADGGVHDCDVTSLDQSGCGCPMPGATRACYTAASATQNKGACHDGTQTCTGHSEVGSVWGPCTGAVTPAPESCAGTVDTNCNGKVGCADPTCAKDPACDTPCTDGQTRACYDGTAGTEGIGVCRDGSQTCTGGHWPSGCPGEIVPVAESGHCNDGLDNDCNGVVDCKDLAACLLDLHCLTGCTAGATQPCYDGPAGTAGVATCHGGTKTCKPDGSGWGACVGQVLPGSEIGHCTDAIDNDCNGLVDCADPSCVTAPSCCVADPSPADGTLWANSPDTLYRVDPATFAVTTIGNFNVGDQMTDVAVTPSGALYGVSFTTLYAINKTTGAATAVAPVSGTGNNGLTFLPGGNLIASDSSGDVKSINPTTGAVSGIGNYGNNLKSSGDLVAVKNGTMYGVSSTTAGGGDASGNNVLLRVNVATGVATAVGPIGYGNVWGLAYSNTRVIGFTTAGEILQIDPATGAGTLLANKGIAFWGAGQSPLVDASKCP